MSELLPNTPNTGIDISQMPDFSEETTLREVFSHFRDNLVGKYLIMHFHDHPEEIVQSSVIRWSGILEDGRVALLTKDQLDQPNLLEFDGDTTNFIDSIYEANDFWFRDEIDDKIWWGIYDDPITPSYVVSSGESI